MRLLMTILALSVVAVPAAATNPFEGTGLIGAHRKPFIGPDGYYRVVVPSGFNCTTKRGPKKPSLSGPATYDHVLDCQGTRTTPAPALNVTVRNVPRSATAALVALNEMEKYEKKDHFVEIARKKVSIGALDAIMVRFQYDQLGSVNRPVFVQALYAADKGKLFRVHFESHRSHFKAYEKDLEQFLGSFEPAPLDEAGNPILEQEDDSRRKRVTNDAEFLDKRKRQGK